MKRRESLNLAHVLDDLPQFSGDRGFAAAERSAVPVTIPVGPVNEREKRIHIRFDKTFLVMIGSELYGDTFAIARNVSTGGILVEMPYAPPLGTVVTVHFQHTRDDDRLDEIVARAEVKHHHYLNFGGGDDATSTRAIGMRFIEFVDPNERIAADRVH